MQRITLPSGLEITRIVTGLWQVADQERQGGPLELNASAEALADYAGAVVLVSHDWHLLELVADRLWLVEDGTVRPFDGDLDAYRRRLDERDAAEDERQVLLLARARRHHFLQRRVRRTGV